MAGVVHPGPRGVSSRWYESFVTAASPESGYTPRMTTTGPVLTTATPAPIRGAPIGARAARWTTSIP